jgi:alpha-L-rhamnosidase
VIIPWTSWLQTGDTSVIEQNWAAMEKYLNAIEAANPDGLWKHEPGSVWRLALARGEDGLQR